jgi:hypothetical protein
MHTGTCQFLDRKDKYTYTVKPPTGRDQERERERDRERAKCYFFSLLSYWVQESGERERELRQTFFYS